MSEIEVKFRIIQSDRSGSCSLPSNAQIIDLLGELDQNPEAVVVKRGKKIVSEQEELEDGDDLTIIPVVSGG